MLFKNGDLRVDVTVGKRYLRGQQRVLEIQCVAAAKLVGGLGVIRQRFCAELDFTRFFSRQRAGERLQRFNVAIHGVCRGIQHCLSV
ncbi:hypothetical protein D3C80_1398160 [compost metagenome]